MKDYQRQLKNWKMEEKIKYRTKCIFCGKEIVTIKDTCSEGICLSCREVTK